MLELTSDSESTRSLSVSCSSSWPIRFSSKSSSVWDYFLYDSVTNISTCQILSCASSSESCGHSITGKYPTNLKQHLKKVHPEEYKEIETKEVECFDLAVTYW